MVWVRVDGVSSLADAVMFRNTSVTLLTNLVQLRLSQITILSFARISTSHDTELCLDLDLSRYRALPDLDLSRLLTCIFVLTCFPFMFMNNCVSNCLLLFLLFPLYSQYPLFHIP